MSAVKPRVFRSKGAWILGWVWLVFAALNAVDLIARGRLPSSLIAGAVLGVLTAVIYATCLRPGIYLREDGVLVRNPLRDAFIPWGALGDVRVTHAILLKAGDPLPALQPGVPQLLPLGPAAPQALEQQPEAEQEHRGRDQAQDEHLRGRHLEGAAEHRDRRGRGGLIDRDRDRRRDREQDQQNPQRKHRSHLIVVSGSSCPARVPTDCPGNPRPCGRPAGRARTRNRADATRCLARNPRGLAVRCPARPTGRDRRS